MKKLLAFFLVLNCFEYMQAICSIKNTDYKLSNLPDNGFPHVEVPPARFVRLVVNNQSEFTLVLVDKELKHGCWDYAVPDIIPAWGERVIKSQTCNFFSFTGTEGRAKYQLEQTGEEIEFRWNNPFISGANGNQYNINAPNSLEYSLSGGTGNLATLSVALKKSEIRQAGNFSPNLHGFKFSNSWAHIPYRIPLPLLDGWELGNASNGLCAGMAFAAVDFYTAGKQTPAYDSPPNNAENSLFKYFVCRLFNSYSADNVREFLTYGDNIYPRTTESITNWIPIVGQNGLSHLIIVSEWPKIKRAIEGGRPIPIGLIKKRDTPSPLSSQHVVVAYQYKQEGNHIKLWVYDPNKPGNCHFYYIFNLGRLDKPVEITGSDGTSIEAFFDLEYGFRNPDASIDIEFNNLINPELAKENRILEQRNQEEMDERALGNDQIRRHREALERQHNRRSD